MGRGHGRSSHSSHRSSAHRSAGHRTTTHHTTTSHRPARRTTITRKRRRTHFGTSSSTHHHTSSGTTVTTEGGDEIVYVDEEYTPWIKKQYKVPIIVISVFLILCCALFVLLMSLLPLYLGDTCRDIQNVSVGNYELCTFDFFASMSDAYFYSSSKDVTAYQFSNKGYYPSTRWTNSTFNYEETVLPDMCSIYSLDWGYNDIEASFKYKMSGEANVYLMTSSQLDKFWGDDSASFFTKSFISVKNVEYTFSTGQTMHIVICNKGSKKITATESGWVYAPKLFVKDGEAGKVCHGGEGGCVFKPTNAEIYIVNEGSERTTPVTILINYQFNDNMIPVMIILPIAIIVFSLLLLGCCVTRRNAPDELPPPTEEKAEQVTTPDGEGNPQTTPYIETPGSATDAPPGLENNATGGMPPTAPTDPSMAPTDPSMANSPYPGQPGQPGDGTDVYGIPLTAV